MTNPIGIYDVEIIDRETGEPTRTVEVRARSVKSARDSVASSGQMVGKVHHREDQSHDEPSGPTEPRASDYAPPKQPAAESADDVSSLMVVVASVLVPIIGMITAGVAMGTNRRSIAVPALVGVAVGLVLWGGLWFANEIHAAEQAAQDAQRNWAERPSLGY